MKCLVCGKRLSLRRVITDRDFCSDEHRKRYAETWRRSTQIALESADAAPPQRASARRAASSRSAARGEQPVHAVAAAEETSEVLDRIAEVLEAVTKGTRQFYPMSPELVADRATPRASGDLSPPVAIRGPRQESLEAIWLESGSRPSAALNRLAGLATAPISADTTGWDLARSTSGPAIGKTRAEESVFSGTTLALGQQLVHPLLARSQGRRGEHTTQAWHVPHPAFAHFSLFHQNLMAPSSDVLRGPEPASLNGSGLPPLFGYALKGTDRFGTAKRLAWSYATAALPPFWAEHHAGVPGGRAAALEPAGIQVATGGAAKLAVEMASLAPQRAPFHAESVRVCALGAALRHQPPRLFVAATLQEPQGGELSSAVEQSCGGTQGCAPSACREHTAQARAGKAFERFPYSGSLPDDAELCRNLGPGAVASPTLKAPHTPIAPFLDAQPWSVVGSIAPAAGSSGEPRSLLRVDGVTIHGSASVVSGGFTCRADQPPGAWGETGSQRAPNYLFAATPLPVPEEVESETRSCAQVASGPEALALGTLFGFGPSERLGSARVQPARRWLDTRPAAVAGSAQRTGTQIGSGEEGLGSWNAFAAHVPVRRGLPEVPLRSGYCGTAQTADRSRVGAGEAARPPDADTASQAARKSAPVPAGAAGPLTFHSDLPKVANRDPRAQGDPNLCAAVRAQSSEEPGSKPPESLRSIAASAAIPPEAWQLSVEPTAARPAAVTAAPEGDPLELDDSCGPVRTIAGTLRTQASLRHLRTGSGDSAGVYGTPHSGALPGGAVRLALPRSGFRTWMVGEDAAEGHLSAVSGLSLPIAAPHGEEIAVSRRRAFLLPQTTPAGTARGQLPAVRAFCDSMPGAVREGSFEGVSWQREGQRLGFVERQAARRGKSSAAARKPEPEHATCAPARTFAEGASQLTEVHTSRTRKARAHTPGEKSAPQVSSRRVREFLGALWDRSAWIRLEELVRSAPAPETGREPGADADAQSGTHPEPAARRGLTRNSTVSDPSVYEPPPPLDGPEAEAADSLDKGEVPQVPGAAVRTRCRGALRYGKLAAAVMGVLSLGILAGTWLTATPAQPSGPGGADGAEGIAPSSSSAAASPSSTTAPPPGSLAASLRARAAIELAEDFDSGMERWTPAAGWQVTDSGIASPGKLALFRPAQGMRDYVMEFTGIIEKKGLSWAVRARDEQNYHAMKLSIVPGSVIPKIWLARYRVSGGRPGEQEQRELKIHLRPGTQFQVRVEALGDRITTTVNGVPADGWSDEVPRPGTVGFFCDPGETAQVLWVRVAHQDDFIGKVLARLFPVTHAAQ
jgi:hypothetical protein